MILLVQINIFEKFKLKEQEIYIDKKMQELLINEGQLVQQRNELENKQKQLCTLLHSSPIEFDESKFHHYKIIFQLKTKSSVQM